MFKWIGNFFKCTLKGWDEPTTEAQLASAYRWCKLYDAGRINEKTFKILLGTLDNGRNKTSDNN